MARFFVTFLKTYFEVKPCDIRITCHLFADHAERQQEVERFWLDYLGLPDSSLRKSVVNRYSRRTKKKRCNRLPHGTCRVVVSRTRITQGIYGAIQEYGGFERKAWLE